MSDDPTRADIPLTDDPSAAGPARRVTGLGGVFFKCQDADAQREWYRRHLGIPLKDWGGSVFEWREAADPTERGYTVWCPFKADSD